MCLVVRRRAEHMTQPPRLKVKVKGLTLEFGVGSISPEPFDRYSWNFTHMFFLVRCCAGHINPPTRRGRGCPMCPMSVSTWLCYLDSRSRSRVKFIGFTLEFHVHSISPEPFDRFSCVLSISPEPFDRFSWIFTHMFLLERRCAEQVTQLPRLKVKFNVKGLPLNFVPAPYLLNPWGDFHLTSPKYSS